MSSRPARTSGRVHPDESDVRLFAVPGRGVLRLDDSVFVADVRYGDIVLRHYALRGPLVRSTAPSRFAPEMNCVDCDDVPASARL